MNPKRIIDNNCTIKEASKVFGVSEDALRYYEKIGLVKPGRNQSNGYRIYDADAFSALSTIVELRSMGFGIDRIREYFESHSLKSTLELLNDGLASANREVLRFEQLRNKLVASIQEYAVSMAQAQNERVVVEDIPDRPCILISDEEVYFTDLPYLFERSSIEHNFRLSMFHCTPCYEIDTSRVNEDGLYLPEVTLLLGGDDIVDSADYLIPKGTYATCTFKGSFLRTPSVLDCIESEIGRMGYRAMGNPYEFCLVGEFETDNFEEHLSRVDVPVEPAEM